MMFVKIFFIFIFLSTFLLKASYAEIESDNSDFLAKETEPILKITNYKSHKEEERKYQEELKRKAEEETRRKREIMLRKLEEDELKRLKEKNKAAYIEKQKLEQELYLKAQEEAKRKRISIIKVTTVIDKDVVDFTYNKDGFYMEDYSELGTPLDTTSSKVVRDELATKELYVRLLTQTNINSRRAGEYFAIVEKDVFSPDNKNILIPKGSKFLCTFKPLTTYGETALTSECNRIYFPNGKSSSITPAQVYDVMGRPGIVGTLDNRMFEKYGQTLVLSLLGGAAILGSNKASNNNFNNLAQYTGLNILDMSMKILEKTIDLAPVVTISSGTRIIVKLSADLTLQNKD